MTDADKEHVVGVLLPYVVDCIIDNPVTGIDIQGILKSGRFTSLNPCFSACVMKKMGMVSILYLFYY